MIGPRYAKALGMAMAAHDGQFRTGTKIPYLSHPLAVSSLVLQNGGDEDQAIIGLLHDVVEDGGAQWKGTISDHLGERVLRGVIGCSDCSPEAGEAKAPWRARKESYLSHLSRAEPDVILVSACDKLHNMGCIVADLENIGTVVFNRFTGRKEGTLWYYGGLLAVYRHLLKPSHPQLFNQLSAMFSRMRALADDRVSTFV